MQFVNNYQPAERDNLKSNDRIVTLTPKGDVKDVTGMVDPDLFKGANRLHIIMDTKSLLWSFRYDKGIVPGPLKEQKFTTFAKALEFAKRYYETRNVEVTKVEE